MTLLDQINIRDFVLDNNYFDLFKGFSPPNIAILSPTDELPLIRALFTGANIDVVTRDDWNLNTEGPDKYWDLIIAANVFHYNNNPDKSIWFRNVTSRCRYFLCQDLIYRVRGESGQNELGSDGDSVRYRMGIDKRSYTFDLLDLGCVKIKNMRPYISSSNQYTNRPIHFIALFEKV